MRNWCHPISNFHCKHKRMNIFTICIWIHSVKYNNSIEQVNKHVWCMYYFSFTSNFVNLNMTLTQNDFGLPLKLCPASPIGNFFWGGGHWYWHALHWIMALTLNFLSQIMNMSQQKSWFCGWGKNMPHWIVNYSAKGCCTKSLLNWIAD